VGLGGWLLGVGSPYLRLDVGVLDRELPADSPEDTRVHISLTSFVL